MLGDWSSGAGPLHRQLTAAISQLIDDGILRHDDRLPPERRLADALSVSRGTVVKVYDRLRDDGLVTRRQGSGTRVTSRPVAPAVAADQQGSLLYERNTRAIDLVLAQAEPLPAALEIAAAPDFERYAEHLGSDEPAGIGPLRDRIAQHMTDQGLATRPSQILVCAGAQQGIALLNQLFVSPGEYVLSEAFTWTSIVDGAIGRGGRIHGVETTQAGIDPDELRRAIERFRPTMVTLNPHHQNPTSTRLSDEHRAEITRIADEYGVVLVEDRVAAHLAFDGRVPPPLAASAQGGQHIVVDSISKVAWNGFRIGWVRADAQLINRLRDLRGLADFSSPIAMQIAAIEVLERWDELVGRRVDQLRRRCDTLLEACADFVPEWSAPRPRGGLVTWWSLPHGLASEFADVAQRFGVRVATSRQFAAGVCDDTHVRLPFTRSEAELIEGTRRLGLAWNEYRRSAA